MWYREGITAGETAARRWDPGLLSFCLQAGPGEKKLCSTGESMKGKKRPPALTPYVQASCLSPSSPHCWDGEAPSKQPALFCCRRPLRCWAGLGNQQARRPPHLASSPSCPLLHQVGQAWDPSSRPGAPVLLRAPPPISMALMGLNGIKGAGEGEKVTAHGTSPSA